MRWHVLGLGSIGGLMATRLQLAGGDIRVLPHAPAGDALDLTLESGDATHTITLAVDHDGPITHLLLTTKAQQSLDALQGIDERLQPDACVVVLQNGIGVHDAIARRWPMLAIVAGSSTEGANRPSPHHIRHAGQGQILLGPWRETDRNATRNVFADWQRAGLPVVDAPDIRQRLWDKLVMNCAINPLTALLDCRNGELLATPGIAALMDAVVKEVAAVMRAEGLVADDGALCERTRAVSQTTAANISSMCTDYRLGRDTEIDYINGQVVEKGRRHGIATPVNETLARAVAQRTPPDWASLIRPV